MKRKRPKKSKNVPRSEPPPGRNAPPGWTHAVVLFGLLLANFALYQATFNLGFLSVDDPDYIQNNPYIEKITAANLRHIFTAPYSANYAPANLLSYALDVAIAGGKSAFAIHLSNVLWHGWVVCMVYLLAFTIRAEILTAAVAALLFLLHPAHVEVVAWISSRKDLVATGFAALAMTCYLLYRAQGSKERVAKPALLWRGGWYGASLLSFALGSAGKQSVILLPLVMVLWDVLAESRRSWRMLADKVPFGLITVFFGWMTWHAQPSTNQAPHVFVWAATQLTNLWLLTGLGQYTLYRPAPDPAAWSWAGRLMIVSAAVVCWGLPVLFYQARKPVRAALCYWVLVQMVPPMVLSFIVPITDRYLFLPSVGACILAADLIAGLAWRAEESLPGRPRTRRARRFGGSAGWLVLTGVIVFWGAKTWNYLAEWSDPRSVWYGAHLKTRNSQVLQFLGEVYQNAGDRMDGFVKSSAPLQVTNELPFARAVLEDDAQTVKLQAEWLNATPGRTNSIAYRDQLWNLAWDQYQESVANRGTLSAPNLFMNRGRLLVSQGKSEKAIPEFQIALRFAETSSYEVVRQETVIHALRAIGTAYWHLRNYKEGQAWFLRAQQVQRQSGRAWIATLDQEVEQIKALAASQPEAH